MNLSLVICTRNRAGQLSLCLDAVTKMRKPEAFELVIVDNASTDHTGAIIREFQRTARFPVILCHEAIPGLARARNVGWRASRGDVVAFTDDDCYVAPDYAEQVIRLFASRDLAYFGGRIMLHDPQDYPITIIQRSKERFFSPREFIPTGRIQGANFGFARAALLDSGGFDDRLGAGTHFPCEDIELIGRLSAAGKTGMYSPLPTVFHHHRRRAGPEIANLRKQYDAGRGAYYMAMLMTPGMRLGTVMGLPRALLRPPGTIIREVSAAYRYLRCRLAAQ